MTESFLPQNLNDLTKQQLAELAIELDEKLRERERKLARFAIENAQIIEASKLDGLTGLENKQALNEKITELLNDPSRSGLAIMLDLEDFGGLNGSLGHAVADKFLMIFSDGLSSTLRKPNPERPRSTDTYYAALNNPATPQDASDDGLGYRFGGDEFVVIINNGETLVKADHEKLVRDKLVRVLSYSPLVEELSQNRIKRFGIRAGYSLIDSSTFSNAGEVLLAADPKMNTVCHIGIEISDRFGAEIITKL